MAAFASFTNIMPDPDNSIGLGGEADASGSAGPGFVGVGIVSIEPLLSTTVNSGRLHSVAATHHVWEIDINYNPMIRASFEVLFAFLLQMQNTLEPFLVSLPQYADQSFTNRVTVGDWSKGESKMLLAGSLSTLEPGVLFNVGGETKIYKITRVETASEFFSGDTAPITNQNRIHFTTSLQKDVSAGTTINFSDPKFKVIQSGDASGYSIDKNGLYTFALKLEEIT